MKSDPQSVRFRVYGTMGPDSLWDPILKTDSTNWFYSRFFY